MSLSGNGSYPDKTRTPIPPAYAHLRDLDPTAQPLPRRVLALLVAGGCIGFVVGLLVARWIGL